MCIKSLCLIEHHVIKACGGQDINLSGHLYALASVTPRNEPPLPTEQVAECRPEPVQMLWRRKTHSYPNGNYLSCPRLFSQDSVVGIATTLS